MNYSEMLCIIWQPIIIVLENLLRKKISYQLLKRGEITAENGGITPIYDKQYSDMKIVDFNKKLIKVNNKISLFTLIYAAAAIGMLILEFLIYYKK